MPTTKRKRLRPKKPDIEGLIPLLETGEIPEEGDYYELYMLHHHRSREKLRKHWECLRDQILQSWMEESPGSRPWAFWEFDAPRRSETDWEGCFYNGELPEARKHISGAGVEEWTLYNVVPSHDCGIYSLADVRVDDPPVFESQSGYLRRHRLLTSEEKQKLTKDDFAAVVLEIDAEDQEHWDWLREYRESRGEKI